MKKKPPRPQKPDLIRGPDLRKYFLEHVRRIRPGFYRTVKPLHVFKYVLNGTFAARTNPNDRSIVNLVIPVDETIHVGPLCFHPQSSRMLRKMRASAAHVHSIAHQVTGEQRSRGYSEHSRNFLYEPGAVVQPNTFSSYRQVCAPGIHFFLNLADAMEYF